MESAETEIDIRKSLPDLVELRALLFMPRWASRINLEIVSVRVERLNEISNEDAVAEGINLDPKFIHNEPANKMSRQFGAENCKGFASSVFAQRVWEPINGPGSWAANPWVWAITFKIINSPAGDKKEK